VYLLYKWLIAAYLLVGLVISLVDVRTLGMFPWPENAIFRFKWAIYLTNWTAVILFVQAVMAAVLATKHHLSPVAQSGMFLCAELQRKRDFSYVCVKNKNTRVEGDFCVCSVCFRTADDQSAQELLAAQQFGERPLTRRHPSLLDYGLQP
jgi:hypothetical protein